MSELSDLLQRVADSGEMPSNDALKSVINRGLATGTRSAAEEKQHIVRQLTKHCARIVDRVDCLDYETANELVESGVDRFGNHSKGAVGPDPAKLADEIGRDWQVRQPKPDVERLDTAPIERILVKAGQTDRPIPDHELDRLDLAPSISRGVAREQIQEAAGRVRALVVRGDGVESDRLTVKLAAKLGDALLDHRAAWPSDPEVPDDDPRALADMIRGGSA